MGTHLRVSLAIWDHTRHKLTLPALNPAKQADLNTPDGWKAELTEVVGYIYRDTADSHPSK